VVLVVDLVEGVEDDGGGGEQEQEDGREHVHDDGTGPPACPRP